jgi:hypothetical protein
LGAALFVSKGAVFDVSDGAPPKIHDKNVRYQSRPTFTSMETASNGNHRPWVVAQVFGAATLPWQRPAQNRAGT